MLGRLYPGENCSAARALELVGERWSLLIIRNAAFAGMSRFSDFERRLGVAPNVLSKRLNDFIANGLMELVDPTAGPHGRAYRLTAKGSELAEVVMALTDWGDRWLAPEGPPVVYQHVGCGGAVSVTMTCGACDTRPASTAVVATPGPGATVEQRTAMENRLSR